MARVIGPKRLIDPDGEGVYLRDELGTDGFPSVLSEGAWILLGDRREWRQLQNETVPMIPGEDDEWVPYGFKGWRWWPFFYHRHGPTIYAYIRPPADPYRPAQSGPS